ncbi:MAG: chromosome segregation protein SMC [Pirellulaceae bacterium]
MLKALELVGFKSFADKTRFEFPPGITVIVGPNGSGKSNVVDAIKWVLGEQSAKSLRGKEMSDVIFKGSGAGRKPMNTAEATIVIDNAEGRLPIDAPEVHVTRRVYRSGEGEYLINGQPSRLRDIRDLFRGTGVGTDAYSLIEQGKVERLVEASSKDRRAIFEEAAGISRFKAKKIEAQRRLDRVDQNLLRLSDIVEEVQNRLRSVRSQASKASRYKEYSQRLQQLRTQVGLADWRRLTEQLQSFQEQLARLEEEAGQVGARIESCEAQLLELELEVSNLAEQSRRCEAKISGHRERIAGLQTTINHQRSLTGDLNDAERRYRRQLAAMSTRAGDLQAKLSETREDLEKAELDYQQVELRYREQESAVARLAAELETLREKNRSQRDAYLAGMRSAAALGNQVGSLETQLAGTQAAAQKRNLQLEELTAELQVLQADVDQLQQHYAEVEQRAGATRADLESARKVLTDNRRFLVQRQQELTDLRGQLSGTRQRESVLEDLERDQEGVGDGVKQLIAKAAQSDDGPLSDLQVLVHEVIETDVEFAPLVDVALGEAAKHVLVSGERFLEAVYAGETQAMGRIGFVRLNWLTAPRATDRVDLSGYDGVLGRADRLVRFDEAHRSLVARLLGDVWLVETLSDAVKLARGAGRGLRLVTRTGEMLSADGTLIVGASQASAGLVSRRSQLRALHEEAADLQRRIDQVQREVATLEETVDRQQRRVDLLSDQQQQLAEELADQRVRREAAERRSAQIEKQCATAAAEAAGATAEIAAIEEKLAAAREELSTTEAANAQLEAAIREVDRQAQAVDGKRQQQEREATAAKVDLAKSEQRLDGLRARMLQFEEDRAERDRALRQASDHLTDALRRQQEAQQVILDATSELALLFLQREAFAREAADYAARNDEIARLRGELTDEVHRRRKTLREVEDRQNEKKLEAGEIRHQRSTLADRLREDYGIELAQLEHPPSDEEQHEREAVEEEIASLRRKLSNIGAVNMDALEELEELETRFESLSSQYEDLIQAKQALERIINKINADSRRLFTETLEAIRTNFQALYRKVFGGGRADIVLEEGVDVLEAGVEIISNPPGKPSFNNSLLSGGEKALTALALLMAIFEHQPSPFCVLDEVDAPWDESNIGRFIDVLKEFLGWTRFVIVTHSKKTMTAATTLYGVTMQESGVSKRVSVRFDDVSDDGHISADALHRDEQEDAA